MKTAAEYVQLSEAAIATSHEASSKTRDYWNLQGHTYAILASVAAQSASVASEASVPVV